MVEAKKPAKNFETYKKVSTLGTGSFGTAYLVQCLSDNSLAVIKQIDIAQMSEEERRETLNEAKILEVLGHPNIVKFREVYKTKKGKLCIVMDYADDGDMQGKIKSRFKTVDRQGKKNYMTEDELLNWFTQIALAMKHCHDKKILHRDLKSQNIFVTKRGMVKLGDFGIARVLSNTRSKAKTVVGTPYYLSPEIIKSESYSFKSDIWSMGVLLYEMAALTPPFNAGSLHQLAQKIIQGQYAPLPSHFSPAVTNLIGMMLKRNPAQRPTIHQLLKVPVLERRIERFLQGQEFKDEFSHTLLHNQNVFDQFKKMQVNRAAAEEQKAAAEEQARQAAAAMENMQVYQPPQKFMQQYNDPSFFNHEYQKYRQHLASSNEEDAQSAQGSAGGVTRQSSDASSADRNEEDIQSL